MSKLVESITGRDGRVDNTKLTLITTLAVSTLVVLYTAFTGSERAIDFFQIYMLVGGGLTVTKGGVETLQQRSKHGSNSDSNHS